ncbi:MAG: hypothetical protein ACOVLC_06915 [Flavobacterium sp.]
MKKSIIFALGIMFFYNQFSVVEYQKIRVNNWEISYFPRHIIVQSFFAEYNNELYKSYVNNKNKSKSKQHGIPLKIEFK